MSGHGATRWVDEFITPLSALPAWQVGLFAAGCALRVQPVIDGLGSAAHRDVCGRGVQVLFANPGGLAPHVLAAAKDPFMALKPRGPFDLAYEVTIVLGHALNAAALGRADPVTDAVAARNEALSAWLRIDMRSTPGLRRSSNTMEAFPAPSWSARELDSQRQVAAELVGLGPDDALALVRGTAISAEEVRDTLDKVRWSE